MKTIVVGAGQAGAWVARTLREASPAARITLFGDESHLPYERPPLSKGVLSGAVQHPPFLLTRQEAQDLTIDVHLEVTVEHIDRAAKQVVLGDGRRHAYDKLVLATGGKARRLSVPGADSPSVYRLRNLSDCRVIAGMMQRGKSLVVMGGGWIGLEVAATCREAGLFVTVIEASERLCARSVPPEISDYLAHLHAREGVSILLAHQARGIVLNADGTLTVETSGGESRLADFVVAGIRLESWANAQNQAIAVGRAVAGATSPYAEIPWFWSDQFGMNLQVLGVPGPGGERVVRGSLANDKFCIFQIDGGLLRSVIAVNMAREVKLAKRWMMRGVCPEPALLRDLGVRLDKV